MSKRTRFLKYLAVAASAWSFFLPAQSSSLFAQSFPPGHWSHIDILDFGGGLDGLPLDQETSLTQWFADHIDMAEETGVTADLRHHNPNLTNFTYQLDISACQHRGCSDSRPVDTSLDGLPEDYFLHVASPTVLLFFRFGQPHGEVTIPGCPAPLPLTKDCRLQSFTWEDSRWIFNPKSAGFRNWMADRLTRESSYEGVFLDEHAPGLSRSLAIEGHEGDTRLVLGGAIREYGGLVLLQSSSLETRYNNDLSAALAFYQSYLAARGKFLIINLAAYSTHPMGRQQAVAAKGVHTETLARPDAFDGVDAYQDFAQMVHEVAAAGGLVDLFGSTCYWGPSDYTEPGNYSSPQSRYLMWRLASYYMLKEPAGSPGKVYFDPTLCIGDGNDITQEWQKGYEMDVGQPVGPYSRRVYDGDTIFEREYTKGLILVRPKDCYDCENYGDSSATTVPLSAPMRVLNGEGELSAPTNSVQVRNAEALVLLKLE